MRFWSTPQSTLAGEVTVLAILETVAATAFSVWLVVHRGTLTHVVVGACIAPFLLLRTEESTEVAVKWASRLDAYLDTLFFPTRGRRLPKRILGVVFGVLAMAFLFFLSRATSITLVAIRRPFNSIRAVPQNWTRVVLATDFHHPPEILPDIETIPSEALGGMSFLQFSEFFRDFRRELRQRHRGWPLAAAAYVIAGICVFVPALAYRYSLKATAIVYLPFLWVLHDSHVEASTYQRKLEDIAASQIERLKRWYSVFVIVFLVIVPAIVSLTLHEWWQQLIGSLQHADPAIVALLSAFLPASQSGLHLEGWHVARGINAMLTLALFFWADGKLRQMQRYTSQDSQVPAAGLNLWLLVRGLLTLYIIGCTLYIVIRAVNWGSVWPVHIKWFPY